MYEDEPFWTEDDYYPTDGSWIKPWTITPALENFLSAMIQMPRGFGKSMEQANWTLAQRSPNAPSNHSLAAAMGVSTREAAEAMKRLGRIGLSGGDLNITSQPNKPERYFPPPHPMTSDHRGFDHRGRKKR